MKRFIKSIYLRYFRNNLHFEFISSILHLLRTLGSGIAPVAEPVERLSALLAEEDTAIDIVRRYDITGKINHKYKFIIK
jgi:hypothetical protein